MAERRVFRRPIGRGEEGQCQGHAVRRGVASGRVGDDCVLAAPTRATDLAGLPPAFIECCSAEVFRDEDVAYASGLCRRQPGRAARVAGWVPRVRPAGPDARLTKDMTAARDAWMARLLGS